MRLIFLALAGPALASALLLIGADPQLLIGADPGYVPRWQPAGLSLALLLAGIAAAWSRGWRRRAQEIGLFPGTLAAALWCAASLFSRPLLVATFPHLRPEIHQGRNVYAALTVLLAAVLLAQLAFGGWRYVRGRRRRVASYAILAALAVVSGLAAWAISDACAARGLTLDIWLCYSGLLLLALAVCAWGARKLRPQGVPA
ncbi:MAG: hypothetical protein GY719_25995 [bacterium]|nr:hypothetical protein [bacterium]